jgi:glycogen debranching enzyme
LPFVLIAGSEGLDKLQRAVAAFPRWEEALDGTIAAYESVLNTALLHTPDERINRGMQWAKANTVRVQHSYRLGAGFTNDPPQDIVVVRDCAWYGLGADWLTPEFVQSMYDLLLKYGIHDGGKLTEYIHANSGQREDYALNINDDTPLFVIGVNHHYAVTGDLTFLRKSFLAVRQACDWILLQRRDGLVWCSVEGADVWGNATWRNIIPGYNLTGLVTEINALCYWALLAAADIATRLTELQDTQTWEAAADQLRSAINTKLTTSEGLYVLNVSPSGTNATRTADLVFPLLAGVADHDRARLILDLLYSPEFHTRYGTHTVGSREAEYHPSFGHGLMGGLWPNLTAWVAYTGRDVYPERVAETMNSIYALSEPENPAAGGHLVPGEFPEWFDGETFESRGMAMSPWMPPTYLWLGVEGLCGVDTGGAEAGVGGLAISPNLPKEWQWLSMRNLPYRGGRLSFFCYQGMLHTTHAVSSPLPQVVYGRDVTDEVAVDPASGLTVTALERDEGVTILLAAESNFDGVVHFRGSTHSVKFASGQAAAGDWNRMTDAPAVAR